MAFAAATVYRCNWNVSSQKEKFDTFRRFYHHTQLRDVCDGGVLVLTDPNKKRGEKQNTGYRNSRLEMDLMKWVAEGRITDTVQIDDLPLVLAYEQVREELFLKGDPTEPGFFEICRRAAQRVHLNTTKRILKEIDEQEMLYSSTSDMHVNELKPLMEKKDKIVRMKDALVKLCRRLDAVR
jgi:hypothetical protein